MSVVLACQAVALLLGCITTAARLLIDLPVALACCLATALGLSRKPSKGCTFYEGKVFHARRRPVRHEFSYDVRIAVVDLDIAPSWFRAQACDHLTAIEARGLADTNGKVQLLTHPASAGYIQNPISVYYCFDAGGKLARCIAEVTNTPWAERVSFVFEPEGDTVAKALHVSPLMDMQGQWTLKTAAPGNQLQLSVTVSHPDLGEYFGASLIAKRCESAGRNERSDLQTLWRYGYQPQRMAVWIYWHAVLLLRKRVPFFGPPSKRKQDALHAKLLESCSCSRRFSWRDAPGFPWKN